MAIWLGMGIEEKEKVTGAGFAQGEKMSIHSSLKMGAGLGKHRNVLTKIERLEQLKADGKWSDGDSLLGIPKVRSIKVVLKKKKKAGE